MKNRIKMGFTLAEILITLVIIGVISAITVPTFLKNYEDKMYNTARLKARATIGEAFRIISVNGEITTSLSTEDFVKNVISKYIKIKKVCSTAKECGFPEQIKKPNGTIVKNLPTKWTQITTPDSVMGPFTSTYGFAPRSTDNNTTQNYNDSYFFETTDGFHVNLFYNPYCVSNESERLYRFDRVLSLDLTCFNALYDMNGIKGPNKVGKDIGIVGSLYNGIKAQAVAVLPYKNLLQTNSINDDNPNHWERANAYCNNLENGDWALPNANELSIIAMNSSLSNPTTPGQPWIWSSTQSANGRVGISSGNGDKAITGYATTRSGLHALCVRKTSMDR